MAVAGTSAGSKAFTPTSESSGSDRNVGPNGELKQPRLDVIAHELCGVNRLWS